MASSTAMYSCRASIIRYVNLNVIVNNLLAISKLDFDYVMIHTLHDMIHTLRLLARIHERVEVASVRGGWQHETDISGAPP